MALTGEEIRARLSVFAARWSVYDGSERGEAQTFLNELFDCYGTPRSDVATFEQAQQGRFLDLGTLSGDLRTAVDETMQPAHVSLWLRRGPQG